MPFREISQWRVADHVVRQIEELIAHSVLRPGDPLPAERTLAEELGVSRATLRDGLDLLVERGLLERHRGSGLIVSANLDNALFQPLEMLIGERPEALDDFLTFRRLLEADAARRAAEFAAGSDLELLARIGEYMQEAHDADDRDRGRRLDLELHMTIAEASGNLIIGYVSRSLGRVLRGAMKTMRDMIYADKEGAATLLRQHQALILAIRSRDPDAAEAASDAHIDYIAETLRSHRATRVRELRAQQRPDRFKNEE